MRIITPCCPARFTVSSLINDDDDDDRFVMRKIGVLIRCRYIGILFCILILHVRSWTYHEETRHPGEGHYNGDSTR